MEREAQRNVSALDSNRLANPVSGGQTVEWGLVFESLTQILALDHCTRPVHAPPTT